MLINTKTVIKCFKIVILITIGYIDGFQNGSYLIHHVQDSNLAGHLANENWIPKIM